MKSNLLLLALLALTGDPLMERLHRSKKFVIPPEIVGKNKPCSCGSGKKFKMCCMKNKND